MAKEQDRWKRPKRLEQRYRSEIDRLLDEYFRLPNTTDLGAITARLVEWGQLDQVFETSARRAAERMVTGVAAHNYRNWREAAMAGTQGPLIGRLLRQELQGRAIGRTVRMEVLKNSALIKSIPEREAQWATRYIAEQQLRGVRSADMVPLLRSQLKGLRESQVHLIARTETAKAETAVTRARSIDLGLGWYEWNTSEDARVRRSHRAMDKVLVRWSDPPSPEALVGIRSSLGNYHAGECPYCRCGAYPVVLLSELHWPHKVYLNGRISVMTKKAFLDIAPGYRLAA